VNVVSNLPAGEPAGVEVALYSGRRELSSATVSVDGNDVQVPIQAVTTDQGGRLALWVEAEYGSTGTGAIRVRDASLIVADH
jgi:hypothetical protein